MLAELIDTERSVLFITAETFFGREQSKLRLRQFINCTRIKEHNEEHNSLVEQ